MKTRASYLFVDGVRRGYQSPGESTPAAERAPVVGHGVAKLVPPWELCGDVPSLSAAWASLFALNKEEALWSH